MNNNWTVYIHISPSNKYYVGITSKEAYKRWQNGKGYRANNLFNRAILKYGWENFQHCIIASNINEQEAKHFEQLLIEKLNSNDDKYGYNLTKGGDGCKGLKHTSNWKKRQSEFMKLNNPMYGKTKEQHPHFGRTGIKHPRYGIKREDHPCSRPVYCITTDEYFECVRSGAEKYKTYGSDINKCCTGRLKSAGKSPNGEKLIWRYVNESQ